MELLEMGLLEMGLLEMGLLEMGLLEMGLLDQRRNLLLEAAFLTSLYPASPLSPPEIPESL